MDINFDKRPDMCTTAYCDPKVGVVTSPIECRPTNSCKCDPNVGCQCPAIVASVTNKAVGISAGILAGIIIGGVAGAVVIFIGSKKTYDHLKSKDIQIQSVGTNPLYEGTQKEVYNPFYEGKP